MSVDQVRNFAYIVLAWGQHHRAAENSQFQILPGERKGDAQQRISIEASRCSLLVVFSHRTRACTRCRNIVRDIGGWRQTRRRQILLLQLWTVDFGPLGLGFCRWDSKCQ